MQKGSHLYRQPKKIDKVIKNRQQKQTDSRLDSNLYRLKTSQTDSRLDKKGESSRQPSTQIDRQPKTYSHLDNHLDIHPSIHLSRKKMSRHP